MSQTNERNFIGKLSLFVVDLCISGFPKIISFSEDSDNQHYLVI